MWIEERRKAPKGYEQMKARYLSQLSDRCFIGAWSIKNKLLQVCFYRLKFAILLDLSYSHFSTHIHPINFFALSHPKIPSSDKDNRFSPIDMCDKIYPSETICF
jgi:hypothetical protein